MSSMVYPSVGVAAAQSAPSEPRSLRLPQAAAAAAPLPQVPLTFIAWRGSACVPSQVAGRAVAWLPDDIRIVRNVALYASIVELCMGALSLPLAGSRGNLSKASAAVHAVLTVVAALGVYGALRLNHYVTLGHTILAVGIPAIFVLYLILSLTVSSGTRDSEDAILLVIFIVCVFDVIAGVLNALLTWRLLQYRARCEAEDNAFMTAARERLHALPQPPQVYEPAAQGGDRGRQQQQRSSAYMVPPNHARMYMAASCIPAGVADTTGEQPRPHATMGVTVEAPPVQQFEIVAAQPVRQGFTVAEPPSAARVCAICCDRVCNACLYECGHMCCVECAERLRSMYGRCAMCRKPIKDIVRLYV